MIEAELLRQHWNQRYQNSHLPFLFTTQPHPFLVANEHHIPPGSRVLCIADGQGRNSTWLAARGCDVTAVDLSDVAVEDARRLGAERGVTVRYHRADLSEWIYHPDSNGPWDAVVAISSYWPHHEQRRSVHTALGERLRPGGTIILEVSAAVIMQDEIECEWGGNLKWKFSSRVSQGNDQISGLAIKHD